MTIRTLIAAGVDIDADIWLDPARETETTADCWRMVHGDLMIGDYGTDPSNGPEIKL